MIFVDGIYMGESFYKIITKYVYGRALIGGESNTFGQALIAVDHGIKDGAKWVWNGSSIGQREEL